MSNYSRRHYIQIAQTLKDTRDAYATLDLYIESCNVYADMFAQDNGNFDRQRFLKACGVTEWQP